MVGRDEWRWIEEDIDDDDNDVVLFGKRAIEEVIVSHRSILVVGQCAAYVR